MPESAPPTSPRLLVVDDDASVRSLLRDYLGGHGFDIVEAIDGASLRALLASGNNRPDLVLLHVGLPGGLRQTTGHPIRYINRGL